jgi:hypothetical protein
MVNKVRLAQIQLMPEVGPVGPNRVWADKDAYHYHLSVGHPHATRHDTQPKEAAQQDSLQRLSLMCIQLYNCRARLAFSPRILRFSSRVRGSLRRVSMPC